MTKSVGRNCIHYELEDTIAQLEVVNRTTYLRTG